MSPADLARAVDLPTATISRLTTGKSTRPYRSSLEPIAKYFSIDVEQLLGEKPLESIANDLPSNFTVSYVPLVNWEQLEERNKDSHSCIPFVGKISKLGFATIMPDASMEPFIQIDSVLVFDPELNPKDRSYVLVKLHETNNYVFRQLLVDAEHKYLKPLHPDFSAFKMRLLSQDDEIVACLVEARYNINSEYSLEKIAGGKT